jgi:nitric oxide reductase NorD protein
MAEAEDVLTDVARHATVFAQNLWRKHRAPCGAPSRSNILVDIAPRLDLLVSSVFERHHSFRIAQPAARPTFLATIVRHSQAPWCKEAIPATDGSSIWLPSDLRIADESLARELYRLMTLQQAMRAHRQSSDLASEASNPLWKDVYLILEGQAADQELVRILPGLQKPLMRLRTMMLKFRPPLSAFSTDRKRVEILYQDVLADLSTQKIPRLPNAADSLLQAKKISAQLIGRDAVFSPRIWSSQPLLKDWWTGELRAPGSRERREEIQSGDSDVPDKRSRSTHLTRQPDVRQATEDEDKPQTSSAWMVQGDESHPHAEDPFGLQRPIDRDEETEAAEFGDMVSDLAQARLIATASQPKEILLSDDPPNCHARRAERKQSPAEGGWTYPEWDYRRGTYRDPGATVWSMPIDCGSQKWVDKTLESHRTLLDAIRRRFEMLRTHRVLHRRQVDGEEIDLDAYIASRADLRAGNCFTDALYQTRRISERSLAITLLIDISGSTDGWISANRRVIDVEREALLLVCIALESMGEPYSVIAFSGEGVRSVKVQQIKEFDEAFSNEIALRISSLEPERYTRVGAAVRYATTKLMKTSATQRLMLLLSDGKPHDNDMYEGRYGVEDTRQAVMEARLQGIATFCLTIDRQAANYLPTIFGKHEYALLPRPELLPRVLLEWMKHLLAR